MTTNSSPTSSQCSSMADYESALGYDSSESSCSSTNTIRDFHDASDMNMTMIRQPAKSNSSSSDESNDQLEQTLFKAKSAKAKGPKHAHNTNPDDRMPSFYRYTQKSDSDSDGISALCDVLATTHLKELQAFDKNSGSVPIPERTSADMNTVIGSSIGANNATNGDIEDLVRSMDEKKKEMEMNTKGRGKDEVIGDMIVVVDDSFAVEAQQRSHTVHETLDDSKVESFNYENAECEVIEAFGGCFPKRSRHVSWNSPPVSIRISPPPVIGTPSFSPPQMSEVFNEVIIKDQMDLNIFQQQPKEFFLENLQKFLQIRPIDHIHTQHISMSFASQMVEKYRHMDEIRFRCFAHLLHADIVPYTTALYYLYSVHHTSQYAILENAFLRGSELDKVIQLCPTCLSVQ